MVSMGVENDTSCTLRVWACRVSVCLPGEDVGLRDEGVRGGREYVQDGGEGVRGGREDVRG